jgi:ATP-dependent DNA helicase PIF1
MTELSLQQQSVVSRVLAGESIFMTGGAGTGKSHVIKEIVNRFSENNKNVVLSASTGIAAVNIGGITMHSALGLGLASEPLPELIEKAKRFRLDRKWKDVNLLIIDEISMVTPEFFEKFESILSEILYNKRRRLCLPPPFGGLQVLVSGDFFQLPPVTTHEESDSDSEPLEFCFQHPEFQRAFPPEKTIVLTEIFRQESPEFANMLSRIRVGEQSEDDISIISTRLNADISPPHGILPSVMYSYRNDVDGYNYSQLGLLDSESVEYTGDFCYSLTEEAAKERIDESHHIKKAVLKKFDKVKSIIVKNAPVDKQIELKPGAQVLLCANIAPEAGLVNGSRGIVRKISDSGLPVVRFANGVKGIINPYTWVTRVGKEGYIAYTQIPLRLGWAVTIHKSQGMTLDYIQIDLGSTIFTHGQAYVALSRAKSLDGVTITEFSPNSFQVHPAVKQYYQRLETMVPE